MTRNRKRLAVLGGVLLVLAGTGVAFAAYLPVKVVNISASASKVAGSCPAGTVTSPAVANPTGTIAPNGSGSYTLTATMVTDPDNSCQGQSFEMPLNASLASAAG